MLRVLIPALFVVALGCTAPRGSEESLAVDDEYDSAAMPSDTMALSLEAAIDDIANSVRESAAYSLQATTRGGDNQSSTVLYFDSLLRLTSCMASWNSKTFAGSYERYFKNDSLIALREENSFEDFEELVILHADFNPVYGYAKTNGSDDDYQVTYLFAGDFASKREEALEEVLAMLAMIRQPDNVETSGDEVTVRGVAADSGPPVDIRMNKKLFLALTSR